MKGEQMKARDLPWSTPRVKLKRGSGFVASTREAFEYQETRWSVPVIWCGREIRDKRKEISTMEEGFEVCPKCNGKGFMRYKVWRSQGVIQYLCSIKMGVELGVAQAYIIRIPCPACDGLGIIDWVRTATRGETLKRPFIKPEGNMDIYLRPTPAGINSLTRYCRPGNICVSGKSAEKLLELSGIRYSGIKLNRTVLAFSLYELLELHHSLSKYEGLLISLPDQDVTEERIRAELVNHGLAEFMPDKFHLDDDEFPG
jgi:hypothetical protein